MRSARHWNAEVFLNIAPPEARRELGFMSRNDFRELGSWHSYVIYPKNSIFLRIEPSINGGFQYDYDNRIKEQWLSPQFYVQLKHQINASGDSLQ